jgi:hypothetical protein
LYLLISERKFDLVVLNVGVSGVVLGLNVVVVLGLSVVVVLGLSVVVVLGLVVAVVFSEVHVIPNVIV